METMTNNTQPQLPDEVVEEIKAKARAQYPLVMSHTHTDGPRSGFIRGATEYATKLHQEQQAHEETRQSFKRQLNERLHQAEQENAALQAKCERYEQLLQAVHKKAKEGIVPHLPVETIGAQKCIEIDTMLNEALSAGEGEKEVPKPEGWPFVCEHCGKKDCESDHK
jgi:hypothetical protein